MVGKEVIESGELDEQFRQRGAVPGGRGSAGWLFAGNSGAEKRDAASTKPGHQAAKNTVDSGRKSRFLSGCPATGPVGAVVSGVCRGGPPFGSSGAAEIFSS